MDIFSTELGIQLSFVKTLEFGGRGGLNPQTPLDTPLVIVCDQVSVTLCTYNDLEDRCQTKEENS
jgi:hypothetical protein